MMGSFMGRGNQYIQLVKVLYCKLQGDQWHVTTRSGRESNSNLQRWEARELLLCHRPPVVFITLFHNVLNSYKSILVHFIFVFAFIESSDELFNIMLNINVMISETMNKRKISLCIATKLLRPNKSKEL